MKDFSRFESVGLSKAKIMEVMSYLGSKGDFTEPRENTHNEELLSSVKALAEAKRKLQLTDEQFGVLVWDAAELITIHKLNDSDFEGLNIDLNDLK